MAKLHVCPQCEAQWNADGIRVDAARKCAAWPGGEVRLTRLESKLLAQLASASGHVVRREKLVDAGWGDDADGGPDSALQAVYVHVCHLRRRLREAGFPGRIKSVWGIGYELTLGSAGAGGPTRASLHERAAI